MTASYGTFRSGDVITAWSTDLRRNLRKIAQDTLRPGESLADYPRDHDDPNKPSRFRITRERTTP